MKLAIFVASAALLAGAPPALAQHGGDHGHHATHGSHASKPGGAAAMNGAPATREFMAAHHSMMQAMNQPYTGDPDADFRIQMIPHHQGAIDMAKVALRRATDPWTQQLAEAIIVEQQREIYDMRNWLARRGVRAPEGGGPQHIVGWNSYRTVPPTPGSLEETQGSSWAPGSGVPGQP